jgi:F-type H+-transporting ATPase subunit b
MQDAATTSGTVQPEPKGGGFPPFKAETFPSQLFWLTITFGFLFVVLWRVAGPRIRSVLEERRGKIRDELKTAEQHRRSAETASAAYQAPLVEARERARAISEETRQQLNREVERAKTEADTEANEETAKAHAQLAEMQAQAKRNISDVAQGAVIDIVQRLTGETISADEAATAVRNAVHG